MTSPPVVAAVPLPALLVGLAGDAADAAIPGAPAILAAAGLLWAGMVIHCVLREPDRALWLAVLALMNVFGALAYCGIRFVPAVLGRRIATARKRRREIERLEAELARFPRPHLIARLGELHLEAGALDEAEQAFSRALGLEPQSADHRFHLGQVALARGDHAAAARQLAEVVAKDDGFGYGEAKRLLARAYVEGGRDADARRVLESLLKTHPSAEARTRYAGLLAKAGETDAARRELIRVLEEAASLPKFSQPRELPWVAAARSLLRKLG